LTAALVFNFWIRLDFAGLFFLPLLFLFAIGQPFRPQVYHRPALGNSLVRASGNYRAGHYNAGRDAGVDRRRVALPSAPQGVLRTWTRNSCESALKR
jgi:hypothetical protein